MSLRLLCLALSLASPAAIQDADWSQFRGPGGLAVADDTPLPARFGPEEKLLWKTALPPGQSSPCIVGELVFLTGFEDGKNTVLAIERAGGAIAWKRSFAGSAPGPTYHPDAAPASPTPVSDGERVIVYFGNYGLVALDTKGEVLWQKRLPAPRNAFGVGGSPLLIADMVVLSRDGGPEAAVLALDAYDGSEIWRIDRFEFGESHSTPFLWRNAEREELILCGTGKLCSYEPSSGELLWFVEGLTSFPCTTPTADEDTLYYAAWSTGNASGRSFWEGGFARSLELSDDEVADPGLLFLRLDANEDGKIVPDELPECRAKDAFGFMDRDQSGAWEPAEFAEPPGDGKGKNLMIAVASGAEGDASKEHLRWSWARGLPYVASPLLYRGRLWLFKSGGLVTCLDAKTGKPILDRERLPDRSEYYMSPVGAAGRILVGSAEGAFYVLDAEADELSVLHALQFDHGLFATPAVLDGRLYLRSREALWAFGAE